MAGTSLSTKSVSHRSVPESHTVPDDLPVELPYDESNDYPVIPDESVR